MFKLNLKKTLILFTIFLALEFLSFAAWNFLGINRAIFIILVSTILILTLYKLEYGLLAVGGELFIGSMGHLFHASFAGYSVSIRVALWAIVILVFVVKFLLQLFKEKERSQYYLRLKNFFRGGWLKGAKIFWLLFFFVIIGLINGLVRGHAWANVFSDINAWFYLALLFPIAAVYGADDEKWKNLKTLFFAGALWLSLKTLFLLFIFTHDSGLAPDLYSWLRKTLVGEMTPTKSGWPRIFIQGQIFPIIAFFLVFWFDLSAWLKRTGKGMKEKIFSGRRLGALGLAALFLSVMIISFSRSFWVAFMVAVIFSLILLWRLSSFKKIFSAIVWLVTAGLLGLAVIYLVVAFPYWRAPSAGFSADLLERVTNTDEPALASRWSLLPVLSKEIKKEPFLSQGYGATVIYFSRDPRVLEKSPSGEYQTYAFEWGYLDIWLKLGLFGLLAYVFLLYKLISAAWRRSHDESNGYLFAALSAGLLFLAVTNVFTPYLNHPLGLGFLIISSCLIWPLIVY